MKYFFKTVGVVFVLITLIQIVNLILHRTELSFRGEVVILLNNLFFFFFFYKKKPWYTAAIVISILGIYNIFYYGARHNSPLLMEFTWPVIELFNYEDSSNKIVRFWGFITASFYPIILIYSIVNLVSRYKKRKKTA